MNEEKKLIDAVIKGIQEKKGSGIVVADLIQAFVPTYVFPNFHHLPPVIASV